jgi:hypothetical protein
MATDFIMPRLADQQQPYAAQFYPHLSQQPQQQQRQQPSPLQAQFTAQTYAPPQTQTQTQTQHQLHSGGNSGQISPLSTSNNASPTSPKSYHGRQLRPLYIPAVLRPTDYPSKKTPTKKSDDQDDDSLKASSSWTSLTGLGALGRLTRRSTGDSGKCMDGELNLDLFPRPTAQPTRKHWKVSNHVPIVYCSVCRCGVPSQQPYGVEMLYYASHLSYACELARVQHY